MFLIYLYLGVYSPWVLLGKGFPRVILVKGNVSDSAENARRATRALAIVEAAMPSLECQVVIGRVMGPHSQEV